jgi:hypothetical protein
VDASATTLLRVYDQTRLGGTVTLAPAYELLSVSARDIHNSLVDNLQLVFSGWGAVSLGENLVWFDRTAPVSRAFGDLDLAYVQGEIAKRSVQLRIGRQLIAGGVVGSMQMDGANVLLRLPYGFGLSAYVGSPVSQRFDERGTETTFNPQPGSFATGGRASWTLVPWGELGGSFVYLEDHGQPAREQVGGDLRLTPYRSLTVLANGNYDLYESRWAEVRVLGQFQPAPKWVVNADYKQVQPDLLLSRNSILSVFAVEHHDEVGGGAQYGPWKAVTFVADYHYLWEGNGTGSRVTGRATWRPATGTTVGGELGYQAFYASPSGSSYLDNGYFMARAFGSKQLGKVAATLDLQEYALEKKVNGQTNSFLASATAAYPLGRGFVALVNGSASATPYFSNRFDLLVKVAYNQSYHLREVH